MLLTSKEIGIELKVHPSTVNEWAEQGTIPVALEKKNAHRTTRRYDLESVKNALKKESLTNKILNQFQNQ